MSSALPRGIRNNNPLNIRQSATRWVGAAAERTDTEFVQFSEPKYGIRAAARVLQTYREKHGLRTLAEILHRWAPPSENDTSAYVTAVGIWADLEAGDDVDVTDYDTLRRLLRAMARMENGKPPENLPAAWYDDDTWEAGIRLAGVAPNKQLIDSRTIRGTATSATTATAAIAVLSGWLDLPAEVEALLPVALANLSEQTVAILALVVAVGGSLYAAFARRDDHKNGRL